MKLFKRSAVALAAVVVMGAIPALASANTINQADVQSNFNCSVVNVPYENFSGQTVTETWSVNGVVSTKTVGPLQGNGSFLSVVPNLTVAPTGNSYPVGLQLHWSKTEPTVTLSETCFTGPTGPAGAAGAPGVPGAVGPQGPAGAVGPTGATGPAGSQGATGAAGTNGTNGQNGATGPQGLKGDTGAAGANGSNGTPGATGPQGPAGTNGVNGTTSTDTIYTTLKGIYRGRPFKVFIMPQHKRKPKGSHCVFGKNGVSKICVLRLHKV